MAIKTELSAGFVQRVAQGMNYAIRGVTPGTWMSPGEPVQPQVEQAKGRAWDYQPGINLDIEPRRHGGVTFQRLRNVAEYCDLVRLAIETRKDQVSAHPWEVIPAEGSGIAEDDPRIGKILAFIERPDGRQLWDSWMRMLIEDLLVIDAAAVYARPRMDGGLHSLEVFDGSTIHPLIDESGRAPLPPSPAYQQVFHGVPAVDFTADELYYMPRNPRSNRIYGYSPVEQIIMMVEIALRRQMHKLQYYTVGSAPDLLVEVPANWTIKQMKEFRVWWQELLSGDTANRQRGMFVPSGSKVQNLKEQALKDDFDEWIARVVMFAFSLPATPFIKQHSRANDQEQTSMAEDQGLTPILKWITDFWNTVIHEKLGEPGLEFHFRDRRESDPQVAAAMNKIYIDSGVKSIDEVREELGLAPIGVGNGIVTATGFVPFNGTPTVASVQPSDAQKLAKQSELEKVHKMKPLARERETVKRHRDELAAGLAVALAKTAKGVVRFISEKLSELEAEGESGIVASTLADSVDLSPLEAAIPQIQASLEAVATEGAGMALKQINVSDESILTESDSAAVSYARSRAAEMVGKRWVGGELIDNPNAHWAITDTTREQLRQLIVKAEQQGYSNTQLAEAIMDSHAFSAARAQMIARTELANADMAGNMAGWRESGIVKGKEWLLSNMHPKVDICDANASEGVIPFNQPFASGDMAPTAHPGCECDLIPVIDTQGGS